MNEIKPVAWVDPKYLPRRREGHTNVHLTLEARDVQRCALYTADQLVEAVTAERERWAKVCEDASSSLFAENASDPHHITASAFGLDIANSIRSAAK